MHDTLKMTGRKSKRKEKMKSILIILILAVFSGVPLYSQVVIDQSDMPVPGDTLRVSMTNMVPAGYVKTAMDTTWNYAELEALGQRVDTFVMATATPPVYQIFFVLLGGANLASPRNGAIIPGLPLTQGFTFFKKNASSFSDLGFAYTLQGLPLPAKYDNPDKYYEFPMPPGHSWSSTSSFSISLPGVVSYSTLRVRSNVVDGWGSLTTPFGTFQTVRVKSTLNIHDSIYIDSLGTGFPLNRNIIEYKWLGKDQGIPLLQINEEGILVTAIYRDTFRMPAQTLSVTLGPDTTVLIGTTLTLHAKIINGTPPYQILWSTLDTGDSITVTIQNSQTFSVLVIDALQNIGMARKVVSVSYPAGNEEPKENPLQFYPNPARETVNIKAPDKYRDAVIRISTLQGQMIREKVIYSSSGYFNADLSGLPEGLYFIRFSTEHGVYSGKILVIK
jgi:hypothetical protein